MKKLFIIFGVLFFSLTCAAQQMYQIKFYKLSMDAAKYPCAQKSDTQLFDEAFKGGGLEMCAVATVLNQVETTTAVSKQIRYPDEPKGDFVAYDVGLVIRLTVNESDDGRLILDFNNKKTSMPGYQVYRVYPYGDFSTPYFDVKEVKTTVAPKPGKPLLFMTDIPEKQEGERKINLYFLVLEKL